MLTPFAPTNFFNVNDPFFLPTNSNPGHFNFSAHVEAGRTSRGHNSGGQHRNILQIYNDAESVIPMLRNPTPSVAANGSDDLLIKLRRLHGGSVTACNRGFVQFHGTFSQLEVALHSSYTWQSCKIPGEFSLRLHQPFIIKKISSICRTDLTNPHYCADVQVQEFIKDLDTHTQKIGNLSLCKWEKSGLGDLIAELEWRKRFECLNNNSETVIKTVMLYAKVGASFPIAKHRNEDCAFSMPLGNDGHWGIPAGLGIQIDFMKYINVGLSADFLALFKETHNRRLKTHCMQTDFLLMNTGCAVKDPGFTWQFEGFAQWKDIQAGLSIKILYQFINHLSDSLSIDKGFFDSDIINTAENLKEWHSHNLVFSIAQAYPNFWGKPEFSFFYKLPVGGERVIDSHTIGGQLHLTF